MKRILPLLLIGILQIGSVLAAENSVPPNVYLSPTREYLALVEQYTLSMVKVSSQTVLFSRDLLPGPRVAIDEELEPFRVGGDFVSSHGLTGLWSPDGSRFVWTEGTPGTGSGENFENGDGRVGIFSVADESVILLPDEDGMPFDLSWSPDSQYLLYQGISHFGTGAGPTPTGVYLVKPNNERQKIELLNEEYNPYVVFHGWLLDHILLYNEFSSSNLLIYDPSTDSITDIAPFQSDNGLYQLLFWFDSSSGYVLFSAFIPAISDESFGYILNALYLVDVKAPGKPRLIYQPDTSKGRSVFSRLQFLASETIYIYESYFGDKGEWAGTKQSLINIIDGTSTTLHSYYVSH